MKPKSMSEWGLNTAKERYAGAVSNKDNRKDHSGKAIIGLIDQPEVDEIGREMQAPQAVNDNHGANYDNDTSGWVRGMPSAEAKPGFDSTAKRLAGGKHRDTP